MGSNLINSNFSLSTKEEFDTEHDPKIKEILNKYQIIKNDDKLLSYNEQIFILIIDYIDKLYYSKQDIPEDLKDLIKNHIYYNRYLSNFINKKLTNILEDGSTLFFKDIISIINLLSRGETYKVFENYNTFNYDEISRLFRDYEAALQESINISEEHFGITFRCYNSLLKVYTKLCIVNSIDIKRRQTISNITDMITETINMTKFTVKLDEKKLSILNNILGQNLYYFSHLPYIDTANKDLEYIIESHYYLFEKICDGYLTSKETGFAGNFSKKEDEYLIYRNNSSYLLLTMMKKLKSRFDKDELLNHPSFKKCLKLYEDNFKVSVLKNNKLNLKSFSISLLDSLSLRYRDSDEKTGQITGYKNIISDFIIESKNYNIHNLEIIHDILLFSKQIPVGDYINIGKTLASSKLIRNDYYEYFKLKALDIIIGKVTRDSSDAESKDLIALIERYVNKFKTASHLLGMFSKLYLSMAYFYLTINEKDSIKKARKIYAMFININGIELLNNEYKYINNNILCEFALHDLNDMQLNDQKLSKDELVKLGKTNMKGFRKYDNLKVKYSINEKLAEIMNNIHHSSNLNHEKLNFQICETIAEDIFQGICEISILGLTKKPSSIIDEGYKRYFIEIDENYSLQYIFPAVYENNFKHILDENKDFIVKNTQNILSSYKKESVTLIDRLTGLQNIHKLHFDLKNLEGEQTSLIIIYLKSYVNVNDEMGFNVGKKYLMVILNKISSLLSEEDEIYYLDEGKIGINFKQKDYINPFIDRIRNFKIQRNGKEMQIDMIISAATSKSNVYKKVMKTLDKAIISKNNLLFYEQ